MRSKILRVEIKTATSDQRQRFSSIIRSPAIRCVSKYSILSLTDSRSSGFALLFGYKGERVLFDVDNEQERVPVIEMTPIRLRREKLEQLTRRYCALKRTANARTTIYRIKILERYHKIFITQTSVIETCTLSIERPIIRTNGVVQLLRVIEIFFFSGPN